MNNLIFISAAKIIKFGMFNTGTNHQGEPYQSMLIRVRWESSFKSADDTSHPCTNTAVVKLMNQNAKWAKDNLHTDDVVNIWLHCFGDIRPFADRSGRYCEQADNNFVADFIQPYKEQPASAADNSNN